MKWLFSYSSIVYASGLDDVLFKINKNIINPLIEIAFVIALVVFLYGVMQFLRNPQDKEKREKGRWHMLWGIIGFVIMLSVFGIINLLVRTFGIQGVKIDKDQQVYEAPPMQELKLNNINIK